MTGDDAGHFIYLLVLAALVGSGLIAGQRLGWGKAARYSLAWAGIAALLLVLYSFRDQVAPIANRVSADLAPGQGAAIEGGRQYSAREDGHFYIDGAVNGADVTFLVDTGASTVVLSRKDAQRAGLDPERLAHDVIVNTANGTARAASIRVDQLTVGPYQLGARKILVADDGLDVSLLGMSALGRFGAVEIRGDRMILRP